MHIVTSPLTLQDALQRPSFRNAVVAAGRDHLQRPFSWVHVGEIPDLASFLHGGELVLSTGVGLHTAEERLQYLRQLAERRVAAVCIELGRYLQELPQDMIQEAEALGLPLIAFPEPVRFVDITRDLNALVLQHEQRDLEGLAADLLEVALQEGGSRAVVERLARWLSAPVLCRTAHGLELFGGAPGDEPRLRYLLQEACSQDEGVLWVGQDAFAWRAVRHGLQLVAHLGTLVPAAAAPWARQVLHMASPLLCQAFLYERSLLTARLEAQGQLVRGLVQGSTLAWARLRQDPVRFALSSDTVQVLLWERSSQDASWPVETVADLARRLQRGGLTALVGADGPRLVCLLLDPPAEGRLRTVLDQVGCALDKLLGPGGAHLGVGRSVSWTEAAQSLQEAEEALALARATGRRTSPLFSELGALRLLVRTPSEHLAAMVRDELGPVLEHDREHGGELLPTLAAFLNHGCRKEETAAVLKIHRQTLYYRLRKLEGLLGHEFWEPPRRLGLELALLAHTLLPVPIPREPAR